MPLVVAPLLTKAKLLLALPPVVPPITVNKAVLLLVRVLVAVFANVICPETKRADVVLFSVIPVTADPTAAEIKVLPAPNPELVIVPVLLTKVVDKVILSAVALLFCKVKFPVPVTPPVTVSAEPAVLIKLNVPTVIAVVSIVNGELPF